MRIRKNESAYILIEVLVSISIVSIIAISVYNTYFSSWHTWNFNQDKINIQQIHRVILARITPYIREAKGVDTSTGGILRIKFDTKGSVGSEYNMLEYGVKDNDEFYYRKGYDDGLNESWGNRMSITSTEVIKTFNPSFSYDSNEKVVAISLTLSSIDDYVKNYTFTDSLFLRNSNILASP
jgi:type II secretory pathway pseudopilin PulG